LVDIYNILLNRRLSRTGIYITLALRSLFLIKWCVNQREILNLGDRCPKVKAFN